VARPGVSALSSVNQIEVRDFVTGRPTRTGGQLRINGGPKGARVVLVLLDQNNRFVQFHCSDSDCSVTVKPEGGAPFRLRACYEEGYGVYQALKLDSSREVRQALAWGGVTISALMLDGPEAAREVQFQFAGPMVPLEAADRADVCDGDFYGDAR